MLLSNDVADVPFLDAAPDVGGYSRSMGGVKPSNAVSRPLVWLTLLTWTTLCRAGRAPCLYRLYDRLKPKTVSLAINAQLWLVTTALADRTRQTRRLVVREVFVGQDRSMPCQIRRIHLGEADRLRDVRLRALSESPSAFGTTFAVDSERPPAYWEELTAAWSKGEDGAVFVADPGGQWVGIAVGARRADRIGFVAPPGTVHLTSMWVAPEARGTGLGKQLVEQVVAWAKATGARDVELWVTCGNDAALSLYRRAGFSPIDERKPLASDSRFEIQRMVLILDHIPA